MPLVDLKNPTEESRLEDLRSQFKLSQDSLKMSISLTLATIICILVFLGYIWKQNIFELSKSYLPAATQLFLISVLFSTMHRGTGYFTEVHFPEFQNEKTAKRWQYARALFRVCAFVFILAGLTVIYFGMTAQQL